jgi:hypothetical protein
MSGVGRVLVVVYGVLALAAGGRSVFQILDHFDTAPVAYTLSALSAAVYIVATVALVIRHGVWYRVAWITIGFEFVGVIVIGSLSLFWPAALGLSTVDPFGQDSTVWSVYGAGYLFVPLVLPVLGMWWLARHRPSGEPVGDAAQKLDSESTRGA